MTAPATKTPAEQKLAWLESIKRPLTDAESDELRRSLHAVYCYRRRMVAAHERENAKLLVKVMAEAGWV